MTNIDRYPVEVILKLKPYQRIEHNKWSVTISGEKREITTDFVKFYTSNLQSTIDGIKEEEVLSVKIIRAYEQE